MAVTAVLCPVSRVDVYLLTEMDQGNSLPSASTINISGGSFTDVHRDLVVYNREVTINTYSTQNISNPGGSMG